MVTLEVARARDGVWVRDGEWTGMLPYEDFPKFRDAAESALVKLQTPGPGQYAWPELGITADRQTVEDSHRRKRGLSRMRRLALGLLALMAAVFVACSVGLAEYPWLGYVLAFAEAAMIGALADWFAVTALFRRPLGLPIPHTNIVQERKDDIGRSLAAFVNNNFLTRHNVEQRLAGIDMAGELSGWLKDEHNARELSLTLCRGLRAVVDTDDGALESFISRHFRGALDRIEVSALIARFLNRIVIDDHSKVLFNKLLELGHEYFDRNRPRLREEVKDQAMFGTKTIAGKLFDQLSEKLWEALKAMHSDPKVRQEFDARLKLLAWECVHDADKRGAIEAYKQKFLNDPEVSRTLSALGEDLKNRLIQSLTETQDADPPLAQNIVSLFDRLGDMLAEDSLARHLVNERLKAAIPTLVDRHRDSLSGVISKTVAGWDARQTSARIELRIGRDLQFIRINGTLVGGLVGLVIYTLSQLFFH